MTTPNPSIHMQVGGYSYIIRNYTHAIFSTIDVAMHLYSNPILIKNN